MVNRNMEEFFRNRFGGLSILKVFGGMSEIYTYSAYGELTITATYEGLSDVTKFTVKEDPEYIEELRRKTSNSR